MARQDNLFWVQAKASTFFGVIMGSAQDLKTHDVIAGASHE